MRHTLILAFLALSCATAYAGDGSCVSTTVKSQKAPCSEINSTHVSSGSRKPAATPKSETPQPDPAASANVPISVILKVSAQPKRGD
jgi:hypothetical protein